MSDLAILSGTSNLALAQVVASILKVPLVQADISKFKDGEVRIKINESLRGKSLFVIQSTCKPVNDNYMELFLILDSLKRSSVKNITAIMPYFGYGRQDRKDSPRSPISAARMASFCKEAGADRLVVIDLHAPQIQGFFDGPVDNLYGYPSLIQAWQAAHQPLLEAHPLVLVSPDAGGMERTLKVAGQLKADMAFFNKHRSGPNEVDPNSMENVVGEVKGKVAIIVDDMVDTAGTLLKAADTLHKSGAQRVFALATHAILSDSAAKKIQSSSLEEMWVSNSIPLDLEALNCKKLKVVCLGNDLAQAIHRIHNCQSVSSMFN